MNYIVKLRVTISTLVEWLNPIFFQKFENCFVNPKKRFFYLDSTGYIGVFFIFLEWNLLRIEDSKRKQRIMYIRDCNMQKLWNRNCNHNKRWHDASSLLTRNWGGYTIRHSKFIQMSFCKDLRIARCYSNNCNGQETLQSLKKSLLNVPDILIIQIDRFYPQGTKNVKNSAPIKINCSLDLQCALEWAFQLR